MNKVCPRQMEPESRFIRCSLAKRWRTFHRLGISFGRQRQSWLLLSEHGRLLTDGKDVVELGAGFGIPGLLARLSASQRSDTL